MQRENRAAIGAAYHRPPIGCIIENTSTGLGDSSQYIWRGLSNGNRSGNGRCLLAATESSDIESISNIGIDGTDRQANIERRCAIVVVVDGVESIAAIGCAADPSITNDIRRSTYYGNRESGGRRYSTDLYSICACILRRN